MPIAPRRSCRWPGCPRLARGTYCEVHRLQSEGRASARARGYDAAWEELRRVVLREEPLCRLCLAAGRHTPSTEVDHIRPLRAGGTHARSNLRALCRSCHSRHTAETQTPGWKPHRNDEE